jgi:hypothetical protein
MATLTTTSGSGTQSTTQTPQSAGQEATGGTQSSNVQPGTATALLNSSGGVPLGGTVLTTVSLNRATPAAAPATVSSVSQAGSPPKHHVNTALFGFSVLLLVVAAVLFWTAGRSVKNTTHY